MLSACVADAGGVAEIVGGRPERRALAPEFGARPGTGERADVVVEAAGTDESWRRALELVRPGGTVVFFGGRERGSEVAVDTYRLHYEELTLRGAFHHAPRHVRAALAFLASGAYPWQRLITHRVRLEDVPGLLADPPRDYLKAAVVP
jgi:L-iditol 2-dehydrogenase